MLIEAVERRNGSVDAVPAAHALEFLSDTGGAYIAAETRALARALGLKPINTLVCSPQSNRMADSFVNTFQRDYVARMNLRDARTVLAQLPEVFEHFNEVHPHSSLSMRSPREFRRQQAGGADQRFVANRAGRGKQGQHHLSHLRPETLVLKAPTARTQAMLTTTHSTPCLCTR